MPLQSTMIDQRMIPEPTPEPIMINTISGINLNLRCYYYPYLIQDVLLLSLFTVNLNYYTIKTISQVSLFSVNLTYSTVMIGKGQIHWKTIT